MEAKAGYSPFGHKVLEICSEDSMRQFRWRLCRNDKEKKIEKRYSQLSKCIYKDTKTDLGFPHLIDYVVQQLKYSHDRAMSWRIEKPLDFKNCPNSKEMIITMLSNGFTLTELYKFFQGI